MRKQKQLRGAGFTCRESINSREPPSLTQSNYFSQQILNSQENFRSVLCGAGGPEAHARDATAPRPPIWLGLFANGWFPEAIRAHLVFIPCDGWRLWCRSSELFFLDFYRVYVFLCICSLHRLFLHYETFHFKCYTRLLLYNLS